MRPSALAILLSLPLTDAATLSPAKRFIATNRFRVRNAPGFEQRWANRKSRLATLDGFRYFTLLRRRTEPPEFFKDSPCDPNAPDYVSCTLWADENAYSAWRKGDAFKEAHGGKGGISAFASMLKTALFLLKGKPSPALYEGATVTAGEPSPSGAKAIGGWRQDVSADGKSLLDSECFAVMNRWPVVEGMAAEFEAAMDPDLGAAVSTPEGLKVRTLMRRKGLDADDGFTHNSLSIWESEEAFSRWRASLPRADAIRKMMDSGVITGPPSTLFFDGMLCLESEQGP